MTAQEKKTGTVRCPVCRTEADWRANPFRPFCSERCRLIDLGKWAAEEYRVSGDERPPDEDDQKK